MMVSRYDDTRLFCVPQAENSGVAGLHAAHWGNATFARPDPYPSKVLAVRATSAAGNSQEWLRSVPLLGADRRQGTIA